ncbi:hypothetical protein IVB46_25860 [Bradyrhizobium sp. 61]|uniref:hypothetical protein n=1 Tax=unclassified Bradyrhizobium TaxID=2631580 RepID=UPI001FF9AE2A|nr:MULTISPECIES: hypothetical protein [unclassified Bradyrhizobium]MCK1278656.1 hypothetical protein [Bradyrhizobium sp. 61]MCK1446614.1 hypothetical protein [Bradyrhizobium sp. 48]MCK1461496.1 hypothetical protein [Bradyrhizobium sp. 2]
MPDFDDAEAFLALSNNVRLRSYPHLQPLVPDVQAGYEQYAAVGGQPGLVHNWAVSPAVAKLLKGHYASPPQDLAHLAKMRESSEHLVCPMCGSMHSGTLDHYLPKEPFPVFAIFSKNLVPACKCNTRRGEVVMGADANERVLHPYFDACLDERLIGAQFGDLGDVPRVSIALMVPDTHPQYSAIAFHVKTIIERSAIRRYLAARWSKFFLKPSLVVRALEKNVSEEGEVEAILHKERQAFDELHGSKNNWNSIFISGLLHPEAISWLTQRLSAPGRVPDSALR